MASGSKLTMQMNKKIIFLKKAPSIKIPKRRASVPVVANLSFLDSNSAIVYAFIAFHDHLYFHSHQQKENIKFTLIPANPLTKIYSIINSYTHLGTFSLEEPNLSGFLKKPEIAI